MHHFYKMCHVTSHWISDLTITSGGDGDGGGDDKPGIIVQTEFQHFVSVTPLDISGVALGTKALMLKTGSGDISSHICGDHRWFMPEYDHFPSHNQVVFEPEPDQNHRERCTLPTFIARICQNKRWCVSANHWRIKTLCLIWWNSTFLLCFVLNLRLSSRSRPRKLD